MQSKLWWLLIPAILIMVAFGAAGLDANAIWNDEWYQTRDARSHNEPWEIAIHVAVQNPWHAPAYFILLNWWARAAGWLPYITRALALFMGVLAVAWTYRLGRDHISPRVGIYAALLLAFSEFFVHYLHETRMYTATVMLSALVTWLYLRVVNAKREPGFKTWLALWFVVTLTLYTHYFLSIVLGAIGLYHLFIAPKNRRWLKITASFLLAGVAFVPWTVALFDAMGRASDRGLEGQMALTEIANWVAYLFGNGYGILTIVFLALAVVAWFQWRGKPKRGVGALLLLFAGVVIGVIVVALTLRVFVNERTRYLIFSWPLLAVLVAAGILQLGRLVGRQRGGLVVSQVILVAWMALGFWNNLHPNVTAELPGTTLTAPLHVIMREIRPIQRPGDYIVVAIPDDNPLRRYGNIVDHYVMTERLAADARALGIAMPTDEADAEDADERDAPSDLPVEQGALNQSIMGEIGPGREYVWVAYRTDPVPTPLDSFLPVLEAQYGLCGTAVVRDDYHLNIDEYTRSPVCCRPETVERPPLVDYGNGLSLMGVDIQPGDDGVLSAYVAWNGGSALPPETYSVALHVLDASGAMVAQTDYGLPVEDFLCGQPRVELAGLPAGAYQLAVIVYNWQTGERLTGTLETTGDSGERLIVGAFTLGADGSVGTP